MGLNVEVIIRIRPLTNCDINSNSLCVVKSESDKVELFREKKSKNSTSKRYIFKFDKIHNDSDPANKNNDSQLSMYEKVGKNLVKNVTDGYNACIFAYGQTGSGKSYTMMGKGHGQEGIIPRFSKELFEKLYCEEYSHTKFSLEVTYYEIYCEQVFDLISPDNKKNLKVREHPIFGPYVENLSKILVQSFEEIINVINEGNKTRTVVSTDMNVSSSRSHAILGISIRQSEQMVDCIEESGKVKISSEKSSKINLIDLAGSEKVNKSGTFGVRLKEGSHINKSLTTLGKIISTLSIDSSQQKHIPYRDSVLTWLLKENLGGNCKTSMIGTISSSEQNYDETLSTLRYANSAKNIVCKAFVNEDNNKRLISELKLEIEHLKVQLSVQSIKKQVKNEDNYDVLMEKLECSEKIIHQLKLSLDEKAEMTKNIKHNRDEAFKRMGIYSFSAPDDIPYMINLSQDPQISENLIYCIQKGATL